MAGTRGSGVYIYTLTETEGALIYKQPCSIYIHYFYSRQFVEPSYALREFGSEDHFFVLVA